MALGLLAIGCATLPDNANRGYSLAYTDTADTLLGKSAAKLKESHPGQSGFHLLGNGLDAFVARAVLTHYAERSIDVQYYLYHNDLVGRLFTDLLLKAANRGCACARWWTTWTWPAEI
jgi:putative cardiolipin synthase